MGKAHSLNRLEMQAQPKWLLCFFVSPTESSDCTASKLKFQPITSCHFRRATNSPTPSPWKVARTAASPAKDPADQTFLLSNGRKPVTFVVSPDWIGERWIQDYWRREGNEGQQGRGFTVTASGFSH
jgi:hypothetical protein